MLEVNRFGENERQTEDARTALSQEYCSFLEKQPKSDSDDHARTQQLYRVLDLPRTDEGLLNPEAVNRLRVWLDSMSGGQLDRVIQNFNQREQARNGSMRLSMEGKTLYLSNGGRTICGMHTIEGLER